MDGATSRVESRALVPCLTRIASLWVGVWLTLTSFYSDCAFVTRNDFNPHTTATPTMFTTWIVGLPG